VTGGNSPLRTGIYFVRVSGAGTTRAGRMVIVR